MQINKFPKMVSTITPQRISFMGGGTDLPSFYEINGGAVISSAIDKYIYVTVKKHSPLFEENYRLNYSKTEHVQELGDIENDIARECLRLVYVEPPIYISTAADLPAASGLGSSSSFAVGLLNALHAIRGERVCAAQLAEEACEVEINQLGNRIGKQDQYAAAIGGLNHIRFNPNGRVDIDHLVLPNNIVDIIFDNCLLIWTGIQRDASQILGLQSQKVLEKKGDYNTLMKYVEDFKLALLKGNANILKHVAEMLEKSWALKKEFEKGISNSQIEYMRNQVISLGGLGGKLSGAGGGGFLLEIIPTEFQSRFFDHFGAHRVIKIKHEPIGSRITHELY